MSNTFSSFRLNGVFTTLALGGCALLAGCASNEFTEHRIDQPLPFESLAEDPEDPQNLKGVKHPTIRTLKSCLELGRADVVLQRPSSPSGQAWEQDKSVRPGLQRALAKLEVGQRCWFVVQSGTHFEDGDSGPGLTLGLHDGYWISIPEAASRTWYDKDRRVPAPQGDTGGFVTKLLGSMKKHQEHNWFALMATASISSNPLHVHSRSRLECLEGSLSFYVNDAHRFYGNNYGNLLVVIQRGSGNIGADLEQCPHLMR